MTQLDPHILLAAYEHGLFPMAESRSAPKIHWCDPERRGIFPLEGFHISRSLARAIRRADYTVAVDADFAAVLDQCANRPETWINPEIRAAYLALHAGGHAHSVELRAPGGALVGGVYGVTRGAAFFGESMFSRRRDSSKIALAWLVHRLRAGGFSLFDTQFLTPHLARLGAQEIPRRAYHAHLRQALAQSAGFFPKGYAPSPAEIATQSAD